MYIAEMIQQGNMTISRGDIIDLRLRNRERTQSG
jgi:hypothetical protein